MLIKKRVKNRRFLEENGVKLEEIGGFWREFGVKSEEIGGFWRKWHF